MAKPNEDFTNLKINMFKAVPTDIWYRLKKVDQ